MSNGGRNRTRSQRVASLELPPTRVERLAIRVRQADVLTRIGLCLLASMTVVVATEAWKPPFPFRQDFAPSYDVVARTAVAVPDARDPKLLTHFAAGQPLAQANKPLSPEDIRLLRFEHEAYLAAMPRMQFAYRGLAALLMVLGLTGFIGLYLAYREPRWLHSFSRFSTLLGLLVGTIALSDWASADPWRAEIIPQGSGNT